MRAPRHVVAAIVALGLLAAGCSDSGGEDATGGTLTISTAPPTTMLPNTIFGPVQITGSGERYAIYDALAVMHTDGKVEYRIAKSIQSDDSTSTRWTIKLRPDVAFSDGTPFDAEAVEYNWKKMAVPQMGAVQSTVAKTIKSFTVVDKQTLKVTLAEPNGQFDRLVATSALAFVGSPTAWEKFGDKFATKPVGAGPFVLKEWIDGSRMRLERNRKYYGERPALDRLVFQYIEDETSAYDTLQAGGIDVQVGASPEILSRATEAGFKVREVGSNGGAIFQMNTSKAPFNDVRARTAIALAFDFDEMNAAVFGGRGAPADTLFAKDSPLYSDMQLRPKPNRKKAQELFDELAAEGKPVKFTITLFAKLDAFDDWLTARLSSFDNVSVSTQVVGRPAAQKAYQTGSFQANQQISTRFIEPEPQLSNLFATGGSQNYSKYSNPEVDAALKKARTSTSAAERKAAYETLQRALARDVPVLYYARLPTRHIYSADRVAALPVLSDGLLDFPRITKK